MQGHGDSRSLRRTEDGVRLGDLAAGTRGRVLGYGTGAPRAYVRRLLAMGLVPGTEFDVVRRAPLGDPVEISVRRCHLTLRAAEAAAVRIEGVAGG